MKSLILENSIYTNDQEKEAFVSNKQHVATAFWVNLLGMFGLFAFSSKKGLMKTYFQDDLYLRLTTISDQNKDLSLLVKLYYEAGGLPMDAANKLTKMLVLIKQRAITSKNFDHVLFKEIVSDMRYQTVRPIPVVLNLVKAFVEDGAPLQTIGKEMFYLTKTRKKEILPFAGEFYEIAKQYIAQMGSIPRLNELKTVDDSQPASSEPEKEPEQVTAAQKVQDNTPAFAQRISGYANSQVSNFVPTFNAANPLKDILKKEIEKVEEKASKEFNAQDLPSTPDSEMKVFNKPDKELNLEYASSSIDTEFQQYIKKFIDEGIFNHDKFLLGIRREVSKEFFNWLISGLNNTIPKNARELDVVLVNYDYETISNFIVAAIDSIRGSKQVSDMLDGVYFRSFALSHSFTMDQYFRFMSGDASTYLANYRTAEYFAPIFSKFFLKSLQLDNGASINKFKTTVKGDGFQKIVLGALNSVLNGDNPKFDQAEILLNYVISNGFDLGYQFSNFRDNNNIDAISNFSEEFKQKWKDYPVKDMHGKCYFGYITSGQFKKILDEKTYEGVYKWLPFYDMDTNSDEFYEFAKALPSNKIEFAPKNSSLKIRGVVNEDWNKVVVRILSESTNPHDKIKLLENSGEMNKQTMQEIVAHYLQLEDDMKANNPKIRYDKEFKAPIYYALDKLIAYEGALDDVYELIPEWVDLAIDETVYNLRYNNFLYSEKNPELNEKLLKNGFGSIKVFENAKLDFTDTDSIFTLVNSMYTEHVDAMMKRPDAVEAFKSAELWNRLFQKYDDSGGTLRNPNMTGMFERIGDQLDFDGLSREFKNSLTSEASDDRFEAGRLSPRLLVKAMKQSDVRNSTVNAILRNQFSFSKQIPDDLADDFYQELKRREMVSIPAAIALPNRVFNKLYDEAIKMQYPKAEWDKVKLDKFNAMAMRGYRDKLSETILPIEFDITDSHMEKIVEYNNIDFSSIYDLSQELPDSVDLSEMKITDLNIQLSSNSEAFVRGETKRINGYNSRRHGGIGLRVIESHDVHVPTQIDAVRLKKEILQRDGHPLNEMEPVFHGCGAIAANMILKYGFKVIPEGAPSHTGAMLGNGIYITNVLDKAAQYVKTDHPDDNNFGRRTGIIGYLFEMYAVLGQPVKDFSEGGTGSVNDFKPHLVSPEWCLHDHENQLVIKRVHRVERVDIESVDQLNESARMKSFDDFIFEETKESGRKELTVILVRDQVTKEMEKKFGKNVKLVSHNSFVIYNDKLEGVHLIPTIHRFTNESLDKLLSGDVSVLPVKR